MSVVPRVSVIVPVHDAGPYLAPALESIAAQTYDDWEAIVVDDASRDASPHVAARFAAAHPDRVVALRLESNVGVAGARNAGMAASRGGELVALLDHDDRWRPDYLEHTVGCFDAARAAGRRPGIVACNALLETETGVLDDDFIARYWWKDEVTYDDMIERNYVLARALVTREGLERVGGFAPEALACDDYDLWLRLMEAGYEVVTTREPVVVWRKHVRSLSRDRRLMAEGTLAVYARALERGALDARRRRAVRRRMVHQRALLGRARVQEAVASGHLLRAGGRVVAAAPLVLGAVATQPRRWGEWGAQLVGRGRRKSP